MSGTMLEICNLFHTNLCVYLAGREVYAIVNVCRNILGAELGTDKRLPIRHLRLARSGVDDRDATVLDMAPWGELISLSALQTSLYAVHDGLRVASCLRALDIDLLFPECFEDLLPTDALCVASLERLVLRNCYAEVFDSLADAIQHGSMPLLRELQLLGSPKGAAARARGLNWPPRPRSGLTQDAGSTEAAASDKFAAVVARSSNIAAITVDKVAAFGVSGLVTMSSTPDLRILRLTDSTFLGHEGLKNILANLRTWSPFLEEVELAPAPLSCGGFNDAEAVGLAVVSAFAALSRLRNFKLAWSALGNLGLAAVADGLRASSQHHTLRMVDLSSNSIDDAGVLAEFVSVLIHKLPALNTLTLSGSDVEQASVDNLRNTLHEQGVFFVNIIV